MASFGPTNKALSLLLLAAGFINAVYATDQFSRMRRVALVQHMPADLSR
jgi:hypothetical protein